MNFALSGGGIGLFLPWLNGTLSRTLSCLAAMFVLSKWSVRKKCLIKDSVWHIFQKEKFFFRYYVQIRDRKPVNWRFFLKQILKNNFHFCFRNKVAINYINKHRLVDLPALWVQWQYRHHVWFPPLYICLQ